MAVRDHNSQIFVLKAKPRGWPGYTRPVENSLKNDVRFDVHHRLCTNSPLYSRQTLTALQATAVKGCGVAACHS
jgi:hypothetical protein